MEWFEDLFIDEAKAALDSHCSSGGGSSVQSDLTVNNPEDPAYVKGRTHWAEYVMKEILAEETALAEMVIDAPIEVGRTYIVKWDDVEYECVARDYDGYVMIGNNAIYEYDNDDDTDTGEPFAIDCEVGDVVCYISVAEGDTHQNHTVSIRGEVEAVHKIDPKYLPKGIGYDEIKLTEILPETVVAANNHSEGSQPENICAVLDECMYEGNTLRVIWDGVPYDCEVRQVSSDGLGIGNGELLVYNGGKPWGTGGNGEPFLFYYYGGWNLKCAEGEHTVAMYVEEKEVHKIPEKYLPCARLWDRGDGYAYHIAKSRIATVDDIWEILDCGLAITIQDMDGHNTQLACVTDHGDFMSIQYAVSPIENHMVNTVYTAEYVGGGDPV